MRFPSKPAFSLKKRVFSMDFSQKNINLVQRLGTEIENFLAKNQKKVEQ